ncbi:hypothetical protein FZ103_00625 [Streptomonospora sp. PA3]|uniref:hypothetical protein n=1 Tax=Streptomonospora sp. PA3 TaxID=2607326 RepID=UPI0012DC343C|nr:hypothetical protein [Streptomonospora sp. PA3]MUL39697.1 hypothetical protein [Streptomonospora sp. PA3]
MSNGLRHFLGFLVGVLVTPVFAAGLAWGPHWTAGAGLDYDLAAVPGVPSWLPLVAVLAVLGLLLGLVTGSRLSPLAALLPGLVIGAAGVVETAGLPQPVPGLEGLLGVEAPGTRPWFPWGPLFVLVGTALFFSALPPSRWRRRVREEDGFYEGPYGGYGPAEDEPTEPAGRYSPPPGSAATPPEGTETTRTMSWDADGMPPRYHVPGSPEPQPPAGWNEAPRPEYRGPGEDPGYARPPRWEDRGTGP